LRQKSKTNIVTREKMLSKNDTRNHTHSTEFFRTPNKGSNNFLITDSTFYDSRKLLTSPHASNDFQSTSDFKKQLNQNLMKDKAKFQANKDAKPLIKVKMSHRKVTSSNTIIKPSHNLNLERLESFKTIEKKISSGAESNSKNLLQKTDADHEKEELKKRNNSFKHLKNNFSTKEGLNKYLIREFKIGQNDEIRTSK
jgi:hypothetical protein